MIMGYRIEAQSPNEVENIRQRVNLQQKVGQLNQSLKKNSEIKPQIMAIHSLLQKNLNEQVSLNEIYNRNQDNHEYIEYKINDISHYFGERLENVSFLLQENIVDQTDLDEIYKYVKNTRTNVNKKLNALKKQIEEQNEKMDKIIELLEKNE